MFIDDKMKGELEEIFSSLSKNVKFQIFTQDTDCQFCQEVKNLLSELSDVSEKFFLEIIDFTTEREKAKNLGIDKTPAIIILGENNEDYGIRFYGIPGGYEFAGLIDTVKMLGSGETDLSNEIIDEVNKFDKPVQMQVFVTPTCPYCPQAVLTAHKFAYLNKNITSAMIEVNEFPHLAKEYNVKGVPHTVINERNYIEGAVPEDKFLIKINESFGKEEINETR